MRISKIVTSEDKEAFWESLSPSTVTPYQMDYLRNPLDIGNVVAAVGFWLSGKHPNLPQMFLQITSDNQMSPQVIQAIYEKIDYIRKKFGADDFGRLLLTISSNPQSPPNIIKNICSDQTLVKDLTAAMCDHGRVSGLLFESFMANCKQPNLVRYVLQNCKVPQRQRENLLQDLRNGIIDSVIGDDTGEPANFSL